MRVFDFTHKKGGYLYMDNYSIEREAAREPKWRAMAEAVGGERGERIVETMKELYSIYTPDVVDWFASLYDIETGGWYYSASARDNDSREYNGEIYPLRPDIESTCQALGFIESSGMTDGKNCGPELPEWMQRDISDWVYNSQDEDGFFYHSHWGKRIGLGRRGRDLMWSKSILRRFGKTPKYVTISDGAAAKKADNIVVPDHMKTAEAFAKYLEARNIRTNSYSAGHELACQAAQMIFADRMEQCIDFLNKNQLETGLWHDEENYFAINGVMKITCVYNSAHALVPRAVDIAKAAIKVMLSDEPVTGAVDVYNPWFALGNLLDSLRECGEEGNRQADVLVEEIRKMAPEGILATKKKIALFKKESGSFSYCIPSSSHTSQGMPVAIKGAWEGDINGHILSSTGLIAHMLRGLELTEYTVPLLCRSDFERYISIIERRKNEKNEKCE